jgi:hypothetical protein
MGGGGNWLPHKTLSTRHISHLIGVIASTCVLVGCGGGEEPAATATPSATPTATATSPESEPGGAGDERIVRVPVELTLHPDGQLSPATVSVPAFLTLELIVHNESGAPMAVRFQGERLDVGAGATVRRRFEGLRRGRYAVRAGAAGAATVIVGIEPGP